MHFWLKLNNQWFSYFFDQPPQKCKIYAKCGSNILATCVIVYMALVMSYYEIAIVSSTTRVFVELLSSFIICYTLITKTCALMSF